MVQFGKSDPEHTSTTLEKSSPNIRGALLDAPQFCPRAVCVGFGGLNHVAPLLRYV
jgi:hypothetical protein